MAGYAYRYFGADEEPLKNCPECDADLTAEGGVYLWLSIAEHPFFVRSRLDDGYLIDTEDGAVDRGLHSATECAVCGQSLVDCEGTVLKAEPRYRWRSPKEWLLDQVSKHEYDPRFLAGMVRSLASILDGDEIQDLFQTEMAADGYFEKIGETP